MNDLDRRIVELKGLKVDLLGGIQTRPGSDIFTLGPTWSTSDAKALDLVDEMVAEGFRVEIHQWERPKDMGPGPSCALRVFHPHIPSYDTRNQDIIRREAICRAYIAAMEWMKDRKA